MQASCQKMKIHKYPQIRVVVPKEKGRGEVFIFYETNEPKQKYFWYKLIGIKEEMAEIISRKLIEISEVLIKEKS